MTPEEFADKLCARLIAEGVLTPDNAAHVALHRAALELYEENRKVSPEKVSPEQAVLDARYGGDPFQAGRK